MDQITVMTNEDVSMTDKDAAKFLTMGLQTMRNWRCRGRGPDYYKLGKSVRYLKSDLIKFRESRRIRIIAEV